MVEEEFIPYEQALALKELGFDKPCVYYVDKDNNSYIYNFETHPDEFIEWCGVNVIPTPTFSQAFRFFREKYKLRGFIGFRPNTKQFDFHVYDMSLSGKEYVKQRTMEAFNKDPKVGTYEESEIECLIKLIEICKTKTNE
jgi:hypothetical protein